MLLEQISYIKERISRACNKVGRPENDVLVIAVTKTLPPDIINSAIDLGLTAIGENRVQEYLEKKTHLKPHEFHFIGHLQRNKVRSILEYCEMVHSVDSLRLAEEIQKNAERMNIRSKVLLEINTSGEASKYGLLPNEVEEVYQQIRTLPNLKVMGLMTLAEFADNPETVRPGFRLLRQLLEHLRNSSNDTDLKHLSMGMSNDFEVAIEEGATMVRIGTAIFGERTT